MKTPRLLFARAALAVAATFGAAGAAQAAVYAGSWDPSYGSIFPSLGWKASATFDVPTACLAQADGSYSISGACGSFTVLGARLDFYNWRLNPDPLTSPVIESFTLSQNVSVNGIEIAGNALSGIDTGFFNAFVPTGASSSIAGGGNYSFSLLLYDGDQAQLIYARPTTVSPGCAFIPIGGASCGVSANAARATFVLATAVPEPQTYALMLGGLGLLGAVARRRRR